MRDHLLWITSSFECVWNLLWTTTTRYPLRTSSWHRRYFTTTGAGCWRNMFLTSTRERSDKDQMMSWMKVTLCGCSRVHTKRHLASREDCKSIQRFRRNSQELRHPYGFRNGTQTGSNLMPCIPTVFKCAGGSLKQLHWNTHTHTKATQYLK